MKRAVLAGTLLLVAGSTLAEPHGEKKKELQADICNAFRLATCGRGPYAMCNQEDAVSDAELRVRWGRVKELCERYRKRFGAWLENGCCDYIRRIVDQEEQRQRCFAEFRKHLAGGPECAAFEGEWEARRLSLWHAIVNQGNLEANCREWSSFFNEPLPETCGLLTRGATPAQP